jgi:hypothetical protein
METPIDQVGRSPMNQRSVYPCATDVIVDEISLT